MKTIIIDKENQLEEINWEIPMVVKHKNSELIIITNGYHDDDEFHGTVLYNYDAINNNDDCEHIIGYFSREWFKEGFKKITEPLTIKFLP